MELQRAGINCQIPCIPDLADGDAEVPPESVARRLRLVLRRTLGPHRVQAFKMKSSRVMGRFLQMTRGSESSASVATAAKASGLKAGDTVRVRTREEIEATLNPWGQLKGCMFMPEMLPYCGTTQRVFRQMERFVDERDYRVKKCKGIVFLEGLHCEGTSDYGRCDRFCLYFWREEWLEKIDEGNTEAISAG